MSFVVCNHCGYQWDAQYQPRCPKCLAIMWQANPGIIRDKHDPTKLPLKSPKYRSVVTYDVITDKAVFLDRIATSGSCFYSSKYNSYCYYVPQPLGSVAGSAIPANSPMPTLPLNSLLVADAFGSPHVYAYDSNKFESEIN